MTNTIIIKPRNKKELEAIKNFAVDLNFVFTSNSTFDINENSNFKDYLTIDEFSKKLQIFLNH
jgi:hypothetical protein